MNLSLTDRPCAVLATSIIAVFFIANSNVSYAQAVSGEIRPADTKLATESITKAPVDADFKKLDGNNDGRISLKEAVKDRFLAVQFDATDINHDGMITSDEYATYKTSKLPEASSETN